MVYICIMMGAQRLILKILKVMQDRKFFVSLCLIFLLSISLRIPLLAQGVAIGTLNPHPSAKLHISSTNQGIIIPNVGITSLTNTSPIISTPATGLLIFNDASGGVLPKGFYWWDGGKWRNLIDSVVTQGPLVGYGTPSSPITLIAGVNPGDILLWDGASWTVGPAPFDSVCNAATANYIQKWTGSELCNSIIYDNGTAVGIGTTSPAGKLHVVSSAGTPVIFEHSSNANVTVMELRNPDTRVFFHIDGGDHFEIGVLHSTSSTTKWNVIDVDTSGTVGIGINAIPSSRLRVGGDVEFSGALKPGGNPGTVGQVLISQGPGTPPVWGSVPIYIDYSACTTIGVGAPDGPHTTYCPEGYVVVGGSTDGNDYVWESIVCCPLVGVGTQNYSTKPVWGHLHPP